ncbi:MAG: hypothetical protein PVG66_04150 [Chromatiales bacterium]|jgi:hypothetical protein
MKNFKWTIVGVASAIFLYLITVAFDLELYENLVLLLEDLEHYEIDELILPLVALVAFAVYDMHRRNKAQKLETEKAKIYKAMLASTHHILNNFLNQMQLFKITAQKTPDFDPRILSMYDEIIRGASSQIQALSSITHIDEKIIHESVAPK